jgi:hypothetical protein
MKRASALGLISAVVAILSAAGVSSQENLKVLGPDAFAKAQRPPVAFVHDAHNEKAGLDACNECHHVYGDDGQRIPDESSEDKSCSECHGLQAEGRKPGLMKAFHLNCKGCHQTHTKGPVMCGECHARR